MKKYPDVHCGLTGMHVVMRDEMHAGMVDTVRNLSLAFILVLAIFILSFRMWSGPLMAMLVLICGITWDMGLAQIAFGKLNIIAAMCSVILVGLGIDYAIHIISSYCELRHRGEDIENALSKSFQKIGSGLLTGAFTTAIAFLSITTIGSDALRQFGFVTGVGIICCLLASIFMLPAFIVAKEKLWQRMSGKKSPKRVDMEFHFLGRLTDLTTAKPWVTIAIALVLTVFLVLQIPKVGMNKNYMELEPEGLESIRLQKELVKRFHMSPDNLMVAYENIDEINEVQDRLNSQPAIGMVESIASVLPSDEKQRRRQPYIEEIHEAQSHLPRETDIAADSLVEQLRRLSDNIIEISSMAYVSGLDRVFDKANQFVGLDEDGNQIGVNYAERLADYIESNPDAVSRLQRYQTYFRDVMKERISRMSSSEKIALDMVPESYRDQYVSEDGSHFLMVFYSNKDIWEDLFTSPFLKTVLRNVPHATGSAVFMKEVVEERKQDGPIAFGVALLSILLLLFLDFKSIKTTIIALIPLSMTVVWLLGLMGLFGIEFTIVNVIGFPLLIGIGIDDGVHVIHRYRIEGKGKLSYVMSSIGKPIFLTSLTTIFGFGSLMSSEYRGYIGLGLIVAIGIGLCFVTSVVILPAILKISWKDNKDYPKFFKAG